MNFLKHRHLMSCSLSFIITLFIFARSVMTVRLCLTALAAGLLTVCSFLLLRKRTATVWQGLFISASVLLAIVIGFLTFSMRADHLRQRIGTTESLTLTVTDIKTNLPYMSEYYVKWEGNGALLTCEYPLSADVGDTISGRFYLSDFEKNINGYPEKDHQLSLGNTVHLYSYEDDLKCEEGPASLYTFFYNTRKSVNDRFFRMLSDESAAFYSCLLLGERDALSDAAESDFSDLGLAHLLSISGMHLGILTAFIMLILRLLHLNKPMRNVICMISIFLFAALVGFLPSLTRAAIATSLVLSCHFLKKRPDNATAICFAVAVIYAIDPYSAFDTGLTLSFSAALGIVTVTPIFRKSLAERSMPDTVKKIFEGLFVTLIALTFTLPFTIYYFGSYTAVSLFSTLIFSPFICAALYLSPILLLLGKLPYIGAFLCLAAEKLAGATFALSAFLARELHLTVSVGYPFAKILFAVFCIGFIVLLVTWPKRWWAYILPICIFTACVYPGVALYNTFNAQKVTLSISETKRNDTICLTSKGKTTIIDVSGATSAPSNTALYVAKTEQYAVYIENYVLVNETYRTVSFAKKLLNSNRINNLYVPAELFEEDELATIKQTALERGTAVCEYSYGDTLSLDGISVTPYEPEYIKRSVMPIHQILINAEGRRVFYAGAAYSEAKTSPPEADYVIAGSYGPLYKEEFSFDEDMVIVSGTARSFYSGNCSVYEKVTNVILNND